MRMMLNDYDNGTVYKYLPAIRGFTMMVSDEEGELKTVGSACLMRDEIRKLGGGKDFLELFDLTRNCADVEVYESTDGSNRIHTDYIKSVDKSELWTRDIIEWRVMDEAEYDRTVMANSMRANFAEWYDDEDAEVLVVMVRSE